MEKKKAEISIVLIQYSNQNIDLGFTDERETHS